MMKLSRLLKDYQNTGAVNALVGVHAAVNDNTFLTKRGDLVAFMESDGLDDECLTGAEIDHATRRFEAAIRTFDDSFRLYQYSVKRRCPAFTARTYENSIVQEANQNRVNDLNSRELYRIQTAMAITYNGWRPFSRPERTGALHKLMAALSLQKRITNLEEGLNGAQEKLDNKVTSFATQLEDTFPLRRMSKHEGFRFLAGLLNYTPYKTDNLRLRFDQFVDYQASRSGLECHRDHLRLDNYYVQVLTLKQPPAQTHASLMRALHEIPTQFIAASEWKQETNWKMRKEIQSRRRHFHNAKTSLLNYLNASESAPKDMLVDDGALALVRDLGACLEAIEVGGQHLGEFALTVVLYDEDPATVRKAAAECFKILGVHDAHLHDERYNLLNAWLAVLPGNSDYNLRRVWVSSANYADLSFLFRPHSGEPENAHLRRECLATLETTRSTPYSLNLHYLDVAHTAIIGATGSGKSFLLNFLLTHVQKYAPLTYIFDLGGSYRTLTELFGGLYLPVGIEEHPFRINPFTLEPSKENLHFLFSLVKVLIESHGYQMSAPEEMDLFGQIENLYAVEPSQRRLFTLANILDAKLRAQLRLWVEGGPYATLFDNVEDTFSLKLFQTFDLEGMDQYPQVLQALLFYVLHRANAAIYDVTQAARFKVFVMDEAWRFFRHPVIKTYILEALKTWRRKNAAMMLATQSPDDLLHSEMRPVVVESCPSKVFLANPGMDRQAYRDLFNLNEREVELIAGLTPKKQLLLKRPDSASVLNLNVGSRDYWIYASGPYDNEKRREAFARYGFSEGLQILSKGAIHA